MPNSPIPAKGEAMPAVETPHQEVRRLSWRIADLLNGLDPRVDYVTIRASGTGSHAVMSGFDIPFGNESDIETLFKRWKDAEARGNAADSDAWADDIYVEYSGLQDMLASEHPKTARELAMIITAASDRWASALGDSLKNLIGNLAGETEGV